MDLLSRIDFLQSYADPELYAWKRLSNMREKVLRRVMIGPSDMKFLNDLQHKIDNIECKKLGYSGSCSVPGIKNCRHMDRFDRCQYYERPKVKLTENPMAGLLGGKND